ncbi:hypothetical protein Q8A73_023286 [Channa argus]|nr:hypothetical protein Q8A73_023286 [Channa argus]
MESLAALEDNNGRIEEDVAPRGLAWMEGYVGARGKTTAHVSAKCPAVADRGGLCHHGASGGGQDEGRGTNDHHNTTQPPHSLLPPALPGLHVTQLLHPLMPCYKGTCHSLSVKPFISPTRDLLASQSIKPSSCQSPPKVGDSLISQVTENTLYKCGHVNLRPMSS